MKSKIILFLSILPFLSCTNDSESDLVDSNIPATVTYTNSVKPIMDNNCTFCHGNIPSSGVPTSLTSYQKVKDAILNKGLIEKISKAQDAPGMMPYGGTRLPQSSIDQIISWKNTGFKQ